MFSSRAMVADAPRTSDCLRCADFSSRCDRNNPLGNNAKLRRWLLRVWKITAAKQGRTTVSLAQVLPQSASDCG